MSRFAWYFLGLTVLGAGGFALGLSVFESTECSGSDFDGECDLAALGGVVWALSAVSFGVAAIIVAEVVMAVRRRRQRQERLLREFPDLRR